MSPKIRYPTFNQPFQPFRFNGSPCYSKLVKSIQLIHLISLLYATFRGLSFLSDDLRPEYPNYTLGKNVQTIWCKLSEIFNINFTWKKIIFGFLENNQVNTDLGRIISLILYCIYKCWILENERNQAVNIKCIIKNDLMYKWETVMTKRNVKWSDWYKNQILENL